MSRNVMSACVLFVLLLTAPSANAQSIVGQLGTLLTEQRSAPVFVPDVQAAVATATTVAGLFSTELSNLPLASSSGGFVYRLDPGRRGVARQRRIGTFPTNAARFTGATQDFSVDTLELELDNRSVTVFAITASPIDSSWPVPFPWADGPTALTSEVHADHTNTGAGFDGVSREYFWSFATTLAATSQVSGLDRLFV